MKISKLEVFVVCVYLFLELASFIGLAFPVRIVGQNLLNHRLWAIMALILFLLRDPGIFLRKSMFIVYLYFLIYFLLHSLGHYDLQAGRSSRFALFANQHFPLLVAVAFSERFFYEQDKANIRLFLRVAIIALVVASVASIAVTIRYPQAVRGNEIAYIRGDDSLYRRLGLGGYDLFTGLPFLLPLLVYNFKHQLNMTLRSRWYWLLLIFVFVTCVYTGAIVAPLFMGVVLLFLGFLGRRRFSANRWLIMTILLLFFIIPGRFWGGLIFSVGDVIKNREVRTKVYDLGIFLSEGSGIEETGEWESSTNLMETRLARAPRSIETFLKSPLIGVGELEDDLAAIEHLFWLGMLAQFGILGAFPLVWLFIYTIRRNLARFDEEYKYYYLVAVLGYIGLGFIKVTGGWLMYLMIFFLVPNMLYYYGTKAQEHNLVTTE